MILSLPIYQQFKARRSRSVPFKVAVSSRRGARNPVNQDAYLALPDAGVFAVADGMGGRPCGELASQLIMDTLEQWIGQSPQLSATILNDVINKANQRVFQRSRTQMEMRGMGSTLVLCWIDYIASSILCLHVGDSRAYRLRAGHLERLTQDHSAVNGTGQTNVITKALGVSPEIDAEVVSWDWKPKDGLLIVSDGITDPIPDHQIESVLNNRFVDGTTRVQLLLDRAELAGGNDDKTVLFVLQ